MRIKEIRGRVCFNGRGDPGFEAEVRVEDGGPTGAAVGRAISPSGASRGRHEALPFPDDDPEKSVALLASYRERLVGIEASDMLAVAQALKRVDGTDNFSRIGGSAAYSISVAAAEAEANARGVPLCKVINPGSGSPLLPFPLGNVIGGGKHASDLSPSIQEILVSPLGARSVSEAVRLNLKVHRMVGQLLSKASAYPVGKGDEGGWSPGMGDEEALEVARQAVDSVRDSEGGKEIRIGVDFAGDSLYDDKEGSYYYRASKRRLTREQQIQFCSELKDRFGLFYMEDPLHEEDFEGYATLRGSLQGTLIVGDDLYTTSMERLKRGIERGSTNGVIVKVNQIGTLGQAWQFAVLARNSGQVLAASHRSGDNEGGHLAHFAVGFGCNLIKCGVVGGERTAKLNELVRIADRLGVSRMAGLVLQ